MRDGPIDKRRTKREKVIVAARCRKYDGLVENVILSDLSEDGCRLYADDMTLRVGQRLTLQPSKLDAIAGQVRWVDGNRAGVAFDQPLHSAVAEHLQQQYAIRSNLGRTAIRVLASSM
jgi:hypothetical protein